jgi:hypothetical protein
MKTAPFKDLRIGEIFKGMATQKEYVKVEEDRAFQFEGKNIHYFQAGREVYLTGKMHLPTLIKEGQKQYENRPV